MRPEVIMLMLSSLDGRLHPSRYTSSPDGDSKSWTALYEQIHDELDSDGWIVGRVTAAEMTKAVAHPPAAFARVDRRLHAADPTATRFGVAIDPSGKLHFDSGKFSGDHAVVLLGRDVPDAHLAELVADGVSYIVSQSDKLDLAWMLGVLRSEFGIRRLALDGGATINGEFLAQGLVDEISVLLCPAIDAGHDVQGIVSFDGGLAGICTLSLRSVDTLDHGVVGLRYAMSYPGDAGVTG